MCTPQVRGVVVVSRVTQRTFNKSEWADLRAQLGSWRDQIREVGTGTEVRYFRMVF